LKPAVLQFRFFCLLMVFALSACTGVAVKEPVAGGKLIYQQRAVEISGIEEWSFTGKISLDDGDRGGSGRLQWNVSADSSELDFHGAMGRGAWHLSIDPGRVVLKEASGEQQTATSVNDLIQERMGWPLPVDALQWWVRGLAAPGAVDAEQFDSGGLLIHLEQFGWSIEINRYNSFAGLELPIRLDARRDNFRVKLAIGRWHMGSGNH
jgi:outer membrane lipoprotein LolB